MPTPVSSLLLDRPLPGIYYPLPSGTLKSIARDWTVRARRSAPLYLVAFGGMWIFFLRRAGTDSGLRVAALVTAFVMLPFWIVSLVSADLYDLDLNGFWIASMIHANVSFFAYGFCGRGRPRDLHF